MPSDDKLPLDLGAIGSALHGNAVCTGTSEQASSLLAPYVLVFKVRASERTLPSQERNVTIFGDYG
ncbi:MAG: hypothetical protein R3C03_03855 [Pirellulaceae bacterium]